MFSSVKSVLIVSLGILGGSIAKALKRARPDIKLYTLTRNQKTVSLAKAEGVIEEGYTVFPKEKEFDIIILCSPIDACIEYTKDFLPYITEKTLVTDVCSTKSELREFFTGKNVRYIGGHPMAGSEKNGYENSSQYLFENAYYIVSPLPGSREEDVQVVKDLAQTVGAIPYVMDAGFHDAALARISHLPHVAAAALVNSALKSESNEKALSTLAAGGFKDVTRIASGDPALWSDILISNSKNVVDSIDDMIDNLTLFKNALEGKNHAELHSLLDRARSYRSSFRDGISTITGLMYELNLDVPDKPGAIANATAKLYNNGINIRNIYISGHRDNEGGQLRLVFTSKNDRDRAEKILREGL
ncbi:MAG: prephenate dehydrogenase [Clostridiales bacterium]|jgi:prephenate dehydrogenase|nr:prephenate dehydrogenase [Clostridiales bacterium]